MELIIAGFFEVAEADAATVAKAFEAVLPETSKEEGCCAVSATRLADAPGTFHIYSRWANDAAFEHHLTLPHTIAFFDIVSPLLIQPAKPARLRPL